jgi:hypothetical protein
MHKHNGATKPAELSEEGMLEADAANEIMEMGDGVRSVHEMADTSSIGPKHEYKPAAGENVSGLLAPDDGSAISPQTLSPVSPPPMYVN